MATPTFALRSLCALVSAIAFLRLISGKQVLACPTLCKQRRTHDSPHSSVNEKLHGLASRRYSRSSDGRRGAPLDTPRPVSCHGAVSAVRLQYVARAWRRVVGHCVRPAARVPSRLAQLMESQYSKTYRVAAITRLYVL